MAKTATVVKPATVRAYVWARHGRTAFLVDARRLTRALAGLPAPFRARLIARLRPNTAEAGLT